MDAGSHSLTPGNLPKIPEIPASFTRTSSADKSDKSKRAGVIISRGPAGAERLETAGIATGHIAMNQVMETPARTSISTPNERPQTPENALKSKCERFGNASALLEGSSLSTRKQSINVPLSEGTAAANIQKQKINADILQGQANQLIHDIAKGIPIKPEVCVKIADSLQSFQTHDTKATTLMLKLYETAASKFAEEGQLDKAFEARAKAANAISFSPSHPLTHLTKAIQIGVKNQPIPDSGLHLPSGSSKAPDGITVRIRPNIDGTTKDVLNFSLSPFARTELTQKMDTLCAVKMIDGKPQAILGAQFTAFEQSLPANLRPVTIKIVKAEYQGKDDQGAITANPDKGIKFNTNQYEISFGNGGKVTVGLNAQYQLMYKAVHVEVPSNLSKGEGIKQMQQMLTVLGIGPVLGGQRLEDNERLLLSLITRTYFPQTWDIIEKDPNFYDLSPADLKNTLIALQPKMEKVLKNYAENPGLIGEVEVYPGKNMHVLHDLSKNMQKQGMYGLMGGIGCKRTDEKTGASYMNFGAVISVLNFGHLSTEERLYSAINLRDGASIDQDIQTAEGVFLRGVNKAVSKLEITDESMKFSGQVQVLYGLEALNRGGICYFGDQFGLRNENYGKANQNMVYKSRLDPVTYAKGLGTETDKFHLRATLPIEVKVSEKKTINLSLNDKGVVIDSETKKPIKDWKGGGYNEVCVDGGNVNPSFIRGLLVQNEDTKQGLLQEMEAKNMLRNPVRDASGKIIGGTVYYRPNVGNQSTLMIPVNQFVHVGNKFEQKMWNEA